MVKLSAHTRLTHANKAANTFEKDLSRSIPRSDTPLTLLVRGDPEEAGRHRALLRTDRLEKWRRGEVEQAEMSQEPLSTFQQAVVGLADLLNKKARRKPRAAQIRTEHEAAVHILESLAYFVDYRSENQVKP